MTYISDFTVANIHFLNRVALKSLKNIILYNIHLLLHL